MKCAYPQERKETRKGTVFKEYYPCGQCLPCRITYRQVWTFRLLLEARVHRFNYFVTLTYNDDHYPDDGCVSRDELSRYVKRLRYFCDPFELRYFGVGEYGSKTCRAHYHLVVFSDSEIPVTRKGREVNSAFHRAWLLDGSPRGFVYVVPFFGTKDATRITRYIAGYVVKKMTSEKSVLRQTGTSVTPEFSLCSRRPGIGLNSINIDMLSSRLRSLNVDVEAAYKGMLRYNGKLWPVGRVLGERLKDGLEIEPVPLGAREILHRVRWLHREDYEAREAESMYRAEAMMKGMRGRPL